MKLDPAFTQQVQDYLAQPIEQRDLQRGAELMLQMNRNRSLHRHILRRGDSVRLERELIKYLRIRLDGLTRREVYFLEKETLPASAPPSAPPPNATSRSPPTSPSASRPHSPTAAASVPTTTSFPARCANSTSRTETSTAVCAAPSRR